MNSTKRNLILNAVGEAVWGLQANMVVAATVLAVLLNSHGAAPWMIGAISAIETAGMLIPQLLGAYLFTSRKNLKRNLVVWHILTVCVLLFLMGLLTLLSPGIPAAVYRYMMLGLFLVMSVAIGVIVAVWVDWLAHLFDVSIRGTAIGLGVFAASLAGTGGALLAGRVVAHIPSPLSYALLYMVAAAIAVVSMIIFYFVRDPGADSTEVRRRPDVAELLEKFRSSLKDRNFRAYLVGRVLAALGFSIMPFIAVHFSSRAAGALADSTIVTCGAAMTVGMSVGSLLLGRLGDRHGHRLGVIIGVAAQLLALVFLLAVPGLLGCIVVYALTGFAAMGGWVSHSNIVIETCPHEHRAAHISIANMVLGFLTAMLPVLAGQVVEQWGMSRLFLGSAGFSVLALAWFVFLVREPREV